MLLEPSHLSFLLGSWISYETSPTVFFKSFWLQLLSSFSPSHSQHSARSTCKENMPSHSKTSIYSQALPSPLKKVWITVLSGYAAENVAYRIYAFGASTIKVQRHIVWRSVFLKTKNLFGFWFAFILLVYSIVHVARRQLQGKSCSQRKSQWFIWILLPFCLHVQKTDCIGTQLCCAVCHSCIIVWLSACVTTPSFLQSFSGLFWVLFFLQKGKECY